MGCRSCWPSMPRKRELLDQDRVEDWEGLDGLVSNGARAELISLRDRWASSKPIGRSGVPGRERVRLERSFLPEGRAALL